MLMVLMLGSGADVGWGQGENMCTNLINNSTFGLNPATAPYDFYFTFCQNDVLNWNSSHGSAHHIKQTPSGSCLNPQNTSEINKICLVSSLDATPSITEGIFTNFNFVNSGFIRYDISLRAEMIRCSSNSSGQPVTIDLSLANTLVQNNSCGPSVGPPAPPQLSLIREFLANQDDLRTFNISVNGANAGQFSQIWIKTMPITDGVPINRYCALESVSLTCINLGLTDITTTGNCGRLQFTAKNDSPFNFVSYNWDFNDPTSLNYNTSTQPNPRHHFTKAGTYNVCVDIVDENQCCNKFCKSIVISDNTATCSDLTCAINVGSSAASVTTLSSLISSGQLDFVPGFFGFKQIFDYSFYVRGKLIIDDYVSFTDTKWIMDSGSEIEVASPAVSFVKATFESCNQMWKGITTTATASYASFDNCTVKDAMIGVTVNNKQVSIYNSMFDRNLICVDVVGGGYTPSFFNNKFLCTSNLKPMFSGFALTPLYDTKTYCGVRATNNTISQRFNGLSGYRNRYDGLRNGIVSNSSSIECKYSDFMNSYCGSNTFAGNGIYSTNVNTSIKFDVLSCSFHNLSNGIYIQGLFGGTTRVSSLNIIDNSFTNIIASNQENCGGGTSITLSNLFGGTFDISSNVFNNVGGFLYGQRIDYQGFIVSNTNTGSTTNQFNQFGITLSSMIGGPHVIIIDNVLKGNINSANAMNLINGKFGVMNNTISVSYTSTSSTVFSGINLLRCGGSEIRQNTITVTGDAASSNCAGISMSTSPNVLYCCNSINGGLNAVRFLGSNTMTRYKQNKMKDAFNSGLLLENTAIISPQYEEINGTTNTYGNIWQGNIKAVNQGIVSPNLFRVDQNDETMLDPGQKYLPQANPVPWFVNLLANTPSLCTISTDCGEEIFDGIGPWICGVPNLLMQLEQGISGISSSPPIYADQAKWSHQQFAYDYIEANPIVASTSTILGNFYNNPPAALYQAYQIEKKIDAVYTLSPSQQSVLTSSQVIMDSLVTVYQQIAGTLNSSNASSLQGNLDGLRTLVETQRNVITNVLTDGYVLSQTKLNQIRNLINSLPLLYSFLAEFKAIKHAWIDYLQYGKAYALTNHTNAINNIASLCIGVYGSAVTDAQVLQGLLGLPVTTSNNCTIPRTKYIAQLSEMDINVSPNPSNGIWNVSIDDKSYSDYTLVVRSMDGRIVNRKQIGGLDNKNAIIDGNSWENGVYILQMIDAQNRMVRSIKLIKIK